MPTSVSGYSNTETSSWKNKQTLELTRNERMLEFLVRKLKNSNNEVDCLTRTIKHEWLCFFHSKARGFSDPSAFRPLTLLPVQGAARFWCSRARFWSLTSFYCSLASGSCSYLTASTAWSTKPSMYHSVNHKLTRLSDSYASKAFSRTGTRKNVVSTENYRSSLVCWPLKVLLFLVSKNFDEKWYQWRDFCDRTVSLS